MFNKKFLVHAGLQQDGRLKVRVEPGLFEWTKWVSGNSLPAWIPPVELAAANFSIDTTYRWLTVQIPARDFVCDMLYHFLVKYIFALSMKCKIDCRN